MTSAPRRLNLYSIAPSQSFLETLAAAIDDGTLVPQTAVGDDPLARADITVLLPTRRACRTLREVFLKRAGTDAVILPRIRAIGDADDDDLTDYDHAVPGVAELPPMVAPLERRLLLTRLVLHWKAEVGAQLRIPFGDEPVRVPVGVGDAIKLADDLIALIDDIETEGARLDALADLVPDDQSAYYQVTLEFLKIVTEWWPKVLSERSVIEPAARRNRLLDAEARQIKNDPQHPPIIAAGSTASIPASARLLAAIATHPNGAVVLPGLDFHLDTASFNSILTESHITHPQYGMAQFLDRLGANRADVQPLARLSDETEASTELVSELMRPAGRSDRWGRLRDVSGFDSSKSIDQKISIIHNNNEKNEALTIALALRNAIEAPAATASLVTPDRGLAQRVTAELERWNLTVDDSAGRSLSRTPSGIVARLIVEAVHAHGAPVPVLALLKHPFCCVGRSHADARRIVQSLDRTVLRGPRPAPGLEGLKESAKAAGTQHDDLMFVDAFARALQPLESLFKSPTPQALATFVEAHWCALAALTTDETGDCLAASGEAGDMLAGHFAALLDDAKEGAQSLSLSATDYLSVYSALVAGLIVRPSGPRHPRIQILGLLEARLQSSDLLILGGLNEGVWPSLPATDPWLSRPMREAIGLSPPERRIGLMAHDFAQGLAAKRVLITRSAKRDGTPTLASRWLQRLDAVLRCMGLADFAETGPDVGLADIAQGLDDAPYQPVPAPAPTPPVALRPRRLSVTQVETWIRNPYAVYARHILGLRPLDPIDQAPDAAERGSLLHAILAQFAAERLSGDSAADEARLVAIGEAAFAAYRDRPDIAAVWWPRFRRIANAFIQVETARQAEITSQAVELEGKIPFDAPAGPFLLTARADRIDCLVDGTIRLVDYKTGTPPTAPQVLSGLSPQLTLEGAILSGGGFSVAAEPLAPFEYMHLSGGDPPVAVKSIAPKKDEATSPDDAAVEALENLKELVARFDDPAQPYHPLVMPERLRHFDDYSHLARFGEWGTSKESDVG